MNQLTHKCRNIFFLHSRDFLLRDTSGFLSQMMKFHSRKFSPKLSLATQSSVRFCTRTALYTSQSHTLSLSSFQIASKSQKLRVTRSPNQLSLFPHLFLTFPSPPFACYVIFFSSFSSPDVRRRRRLLFFFRESRRRKNNSNFVYQ